LSETTGILPASAAIRPRTEFDDWRSITIALYMTLIGYGVLVGMPVITTAWVDLLGFTEEQVGRVAGADQGGLALGAVLASLVMARWNRRHLAIAGLLIAVASNGLCMVFTSYEQTLWLRVGAGLGSGVYTAVAVATLGGTAKPARAFNFMLAAFAFSQAAEMRVLPLLSINGIYWAFIICFLVSLPFMRWFPARPTPQTTADSRATPGITLQRIPRYLPWVCLGAILFTYINIGAYWAYIQLATVDAGLNQEWVGELLVWFSFGSIVGCIFATLVSNRWGLGRPLMFTLLVMTVIVGILGFDITTVTIFISLAMFNFLWIFIDVYQMGTVAVIDRKGTFASLMPGAQGLGYIIGPNIAASLLAAGMGYAAVFLMCASAALAGMFIYLLMYLRLRHRIPELAPAP
jgi:predicted MFS family arabinose efflux permease